MNLEERNWTYIQCQTCGHIYIVEDKITIEDCMVHMECPKCGGGVGLNCGNDELDMYEFINVNIEQRYYLY